MYYVDPFIFIIEKVNIQTKVDDETGRYYITTDSAYLDTTHVFEKLPDAKIFALQLLDDFFHDMSNQIINTKEE